MINKYSCINIYENKKKIQNYLLKFSMEKNFQLLKNIKIFIKLKQITINM